MGIKSKRGSVLDIFLILVVLLVGTVTLVVGHEVVGQITPLMQEEIGSVPIANETLVKMEASTAIFDSFFVAVFVGLILFMVLSAFLVNIHPAFMVVSILLLAIAIIVAVPISNFYQTFITSVGNESAFTMMSFIMVNLPFITAILGTLSMVIIYGKLKSGGAR